jgi:hypothetical protein
MAGIRAAADVPYQPRVSVLNVGFTQLRSDALRPFRSLAHVSSSPRPLSSRAVIRLVWSRRLDSLQTRQQTVPKSRPQFFPRMFLMVPVISLIALGVAKQGI